MTGTSRPVTQALARLRTTAKSFSRAIFCRTVSPMAYNVNGGCCPLASSAWRMRMSEPTAGGGEFAPTASMRKYVQACLALDVPADRESRCHAAGVSPRALARWHSDPRFAGWLREEVHRRLSENIWEVWAVLNRLARSGNIQAARLFLAQFAPADSDRTSIGPDTFSSLADLARTVIDDVPQSRASGVEP